MNSNKNKKILISSAHYFLFPIITFAATQQYVPISSKGALESLGLSQQSINDLPTFLGAIYNFGIAAAVALTVIMLIWAGIEKMTTESYTGKSDAKKKINNAIGGLALALFSYIILYIINPCLVDFVGSKGCKNANTLLKGVPLTVPPSTNPYDTSNAVTLDSGSCQNCVNGSNYGLSCKDWNSCLLNENLAQKLQEILNNNGARITEGYPPTVSHLDKCHNNGSCVDINFNDGSSDPIRVKKLYDELVAAGIKAVYESSNCQIYKDAGVSNCRLYPTSTGSHFHIEL